MRKRSLEEIIVFIVAAALPAYLLRFHIGPMPMTALEVILLAGIAALVINVAITHTTLPYIKGGVISYPPLRVRGGRWGYDFFAYNKLLSAGSALILITSIISIVVAPDKNAALGIAKAYFWEPMILAWLIITAKPDREKIFRAVLTGFMVSAGVVIAYGLIQFAFPHLIPATWTAERRITSIFDYPNAAALYLAPLVPLFLAAPLGLVVSGLSLVTIILAKSAGGLTAAAAALFFIGVANKKTRIITGAAAIVVALTVFLAPQAVGLREQILMQDWSGRVHRIGWSESWAMLKDHPFFGAGLSGYPVAVAPYHHAQGVEIFQYPHNLFLAAWSELGLIGLIGLIMVLVWFFRRAYVLRSTNYVLFLAAAMLAIIVHGLVDVPYFKNDLSMMFWLFAVIMAL
jgi:O-antigen ligase